MDNSMLVKDLIADEGLRLKPYRDTAGKLTIGIGRNLDDDGITREEAFYLLNNDIQRIKGEMACLQNFSQLCELRQRVLTEMAFNMGLGGLREFKGMWQAIQVKDWDGAAKAMLDSRWAKEVGERAIRLAMWMRTGEDAASQPQKG